MAKNKGKKKVKRQKVNDVLELILVSMETISSRLARLEQKLGSGPERSPRAGGGRSQPVTKKKSIRKKSVTGKVVSTKAVTKKVVARKKAAARNVTRKKTLTIPAATKKVAPK